MSSPDRSFVSQGTRFISEINPEQMLRLKQRDQMLSSLKRNLLASGVPKGELPAHVAKILARSEKS